MTGKIFRMLYYIILDVCVLSVVGFCKFFDIAAPAGLFLDEKLAQNLLFLLVTDPYFVSYFLECS